MKPYRVAIAGTGMIANGAHIPAMQALKDRFQVIAVSDERKEAAGFTARKLQVPAYTDTQAMLEEMRPDILVVTTPNATHKKYALMGLGQGAHVVVEKPVAMTYADAQEILTAAEKTGKCFFPAQTGRFTNESMVLRRWIKEGLLGHIYLMDMDLIRRRGVPQWGQFHMRAHNVGGAFADIAVHQIDTMLDACGNPALKSAWARFHTGLERDGEQVMVSDKEGGAYDGTFVPRPFDRSQIDVEEFAVGCIGLENGLTVSFRVSWAIDLPDRSEVRYVGSKGGISLPRMQLYKNVAGCQSVIEPKVFDNSLNAVQGWGHWECYAAIARALDGIEKYPVTKAQILNTAAILEAVYLSAKENREVRAGEIIGG